MGCDALSTAAMAARSRISAACGIVLPPWKASPCASVWLPSEAYGSDPALLNRLLTRSVG